jgi:hypothetical protein
MIDRTLARELSVQEFEGQFALHWYEHVPVDVTRSSAAAVYSGIIERLEFIMEQPSAVERHDGWIDFEQFLEWLSGERRKLVSPGIVIQRHEPPG